MLTFQQQIENLTFEITFAFDPRFKKIIKSWQKSIQHIPLENYLWSKSEKSKIKIFLNSVGMPQKEFLYSDLKAMGDVFFGFNLFLKINRFHLFKEFDLVLQHAKLVDALCAAADLASSEDNEIHKCVADIEEFFSGFGHAEFKLEQDNIISKCRKISLPKDKANLDDYVCLLFFSVFAHLDGVIHSLAFPEIKPISLGWLFMRKLDPKVFQYMGELKFNRKYEHKAVWTNPTRSLIKFLTAFACFCKNDKKNMPENLYGQELLKILNSSLTDLDAELVSLVKKGNEGRGLSFMELAWIWNDEKGEIDVRGIGQDIKDETFNIINGLDVERRDESLSPDFNNLLAIWLIYQFFQILYKNQYSKNRNQTTYHSEYYSYWVMFNEHYQKPLKENEQFNWPNELIDLAQPLGD